MPDNLESRMNFIIEQQAQFAVDIQLLKERESAALRMIEANTGMIRQLVDVNLSLARHLEETDRRLGARIDQLGARIDQLGARMDQLAESGAHTDRRLDALVDIVDKLARRNSS